MTTAIVCVCRGGGALLGLCHSDRVHGTSCVHLQCWWGPKVAQHAHHRYKQLLAPHRVPAGWEAVAFLGSSSSPRLASRTSTRFYRLAAAGKLKVLGLRSSRKTCTKEMQRKRPILRSTSQEFLWQHPQQLSSSCAGPCDRLLPFLVLSA